MISELVSELVSELILELIPKLIGDPDGCPLTMWAGGVPVLIGRLAGLAGGVSSGLDGLDRGLARFLGFAP